MPAKSRASKKRLSVKSHLDLPVSRFVQPPVIVYGDDAVRDAAKLIRDQQVGSVLVAEKGGSKCLRDICEKP